MAYHHHKIRNIFPMWGLVEENRSTMAFASSLRTSSMRRYSLSYGGGTPSLPPSPLPSSSTGFAQSCLTVFGSVCCTRQCEASTTTTSGNVSSTFSARARLETGLSSTNFARTATPTSSGSSSESLPLSSDIAQREASPVHIQSETREP